MQGDKANVETDIPLYWDSWDHRHHLRNNLSPQVRMKIRSSVPSDESGINGQMRYYNFPVHSPQIKLKLFGF